MPFEGGEELFGGGRHRLSETEDEGQLQPSVTRDDLHERLDRGFVEGLGVLELEDGFRIDLAEPIARVHEGRRGLRLPAGPQDAPPRAHGDARRELVTGVLAQGDGDVHPRLLERPEGRVGRVGVHDDAMARNGSPRGPDHDHVSGTGERSPDLFARHVRHVVTTREPTSPRLGAWLNATASPRAPRARRKPVRGAGRACSTRVRGDG